MKFAKMSRLVAALSVGAVALTACGSSESAEATDDAVHIVYTPFDEGVAATYLWKHIFEEQGYDVELTLADVGPTYAAVSQDDADFYFASNPESHSEYVDEYGDGFEFVGAWYEPLRHALVVPDYVHAAGIEEIEDLKGRADEFGGQIVGVEAGAGITREAHEAVETYELDEYELVDSSTAAMLSEFGAAVANEEWVVATAWNPHWAVAEYDMEFLDDPEGIFADGDTYEIVASESAQQREDLMAMVSAFEMNDDQLFSLLAELRDAEEDNEEAAIEAWLADDEHQELVDSWVAAADTK
ncbi:MAG TPA: glycine betaine ABC transporter substrate-binding protein [Enteractinococcus sp.]